MDQYFGAVNIANVKPIRDIVYENLRKAIMDGKLQPGERIVEKDYAEKMNISRTPIREALRKLEIEGLVQYIPRKGVVVNGFNHEDIVEIYAIRKALEGLAMKYVIQKITEEEIGKLKKLTDCMESSNAAGDYESLFNTCKEFNEVILRASRMPKITGLINTMQEYLERFRRITMSKRTRRESAIQEHKAILQAIIDRDAERAERLVYEHLDASERVFFEGL
ncbi:GntR family transcriptional regulator [Anaerosolibacter sp.]|uniref:GntR family transcriptional regulator n=1 Tax=Anaerosolibacter sp. TaxID=1872527 RepID=UPI0039F01EE0